MTALYDFFLHVIATFPQWGTAILLGWIVSSTMTQAFKYRLPFSIRSDRRHVLAQAFAFVTGWATVVWLLPNPLGIILGFVTGFWSPYFYRIGILWLSNRYPKAADILSADVRGTVFGRFRASQKPRSTPT